MSLECRVIGRHSRRSRRRLIHRAAVFTNAIANRVPSSMSAAPSGSALAATRFCAYNAVTVTTHPSFSRMATGIRGR